LAAGRSRSITADTALRLAAFFGTDAQSWTNLQSHYDTETARADIWREGKFLTREDEEFIRDSKLAQKDKESAQKIEAEREAKKILEKLVL
jgi:plasmid maintenance system antidote protein VapI